LAVPSTAAAAAAAAAAACGVLNSLALLGATWAGAAIMAMWAHEKHTALVLQFDGREGRPLFPPSRRRLIPFVF
jgi:hypothetical protein